MLRVQRAEWQPRQFLPSALQPRALSLSLHLERNTASRVFPLCPTITHTTNQACGFLPEEQELVKEFLNAKSESNRNNKEGGKSKEERCLSSQSPCALGRMSQEPHPLLRIQASTVGAAAGTCKQHSSFTLSGASCVCVCLTGRRQSAGASRHVVVLIWTVFVSFHIVSVYK